jgi:hypothetical protein
MAADMHAAGTDEPLLYVVGRVIALLLTHRPWNFVQYIAPARYLFVSLNPSL